MSVIKIIKAAIKEQGLTQQVVAEKMGMQQSALNKYLNGKLRLDIDDGIQLARILKLDPKLFVEGKKVTNSIGSVPIVGKASCGVPNGYYGDECEPYAVMGYLARDGVYAVIADGQSMMPQIRDGAILLCDKYAKVEHNSIVHYNYDGESGIKRILFSKDGSIVTLAPDNKDGFEPIIIDLKNIELELKAYRVIQIQQDPV